MHMVKLAHAHPFSAIGQQELNALAQQRHYRLMRCSNPRHVLTHERQRGLELRQRLNCIVQRLNLAPLPPSFFLALCDLIGFWLAPILQ